MRGVAVLGSTGSIGVSTLAVLKRHPDRFRLVAITAGSNADRLAQQQAEWRPAFASLANGNGNGGTAGRAALLEAATHPDVDIVVNAVVGFAGLEATLAALWAGKRVALANKESLVTGGPLVERARLEGGGELVPVDSEHSAVLQCLSHAAAPCSRIILTASGGPFRDWEADRIATATVEQALCHPTWRMGSKISIDSATLANKALEVIEGHYLFGLPYDAIDVVVHPQSIVHGFVEFADGSVLAQLGYPTMELPILYALTHPERLGDAGVRRFDPVAAASLTFEPVRHEVFRAFALGLAAGRQGGLAPTAFNAANEVAVARFLANQLAFGRIAEIIETVLARFPGGPVSDLGDVQEADAWARAVAESLI
ncbi:MAG: 1-deoxy-D-xylulose-5-phosphate reductoisomerase [Gemmatimonadetes bacterium]|nr:1-deoxy-D-xylulose-5-phosphate reductoisomerase [Gemmatimonadota bacterium]